MCHNCYTVEDMTDEERAARAETLTKLVSEQAEYLSTIKPGWRSLVNVETLDISSGALCVLGQVFAEEAGKYNEEHPSDCRCCVATGYSWFQRAGYDVGDEYDDAAFCADEYTSEELTAAWVKELSA